MVMRCRRRRVCRVGDRRRACSSSNSMDRDIHLHRRMVTLVVVHMVSKVATVSKVDTVSRVAMVSREDILVGRVVGILARTTDILLDSTMDTMGKDMEISTGTAMEMATTVIKDSSHDGQVEKLRNKTARIILRCYA